MIPGLFASIALPLIGSILGELFTMKERKWLSEETAKSKQTAQELMKTLNTSTQQDEATALSLKSVMSEHAVNTQHSHNALKQYFKA